MAKYLVVFGTRPEAIKMAPVLRALEEDPQAEGVPCCTGQHQELLTSILSLFRIEPRYHLHVMAQNQQLASLTSILLAELDKVMRLERPDRVLVQGDTTTAMVAAMAATYQKIPVAHIEAGVRSHNPLEPFPEEMNRRVIDVIADLFFAPTMVEQTDLIREGIPPSHIYVTGNTSIDALREVAPLPFALQGSVLESLPLRSKRVVLATVHRRENHGQPLINICNAFRLLAHRYRNSMHIVIPVHPNPNVNACVHRFLADIPNITLTAPLGYHELVTLAQCCYFALTDSGGLQEELTWLGKPALVLRNVTDRREAVDAGAATLVGTDTKTIVTSAIELMENKSLYQRMAQQREIFGDGNSARRIVSVLQNHHAWMPPASETSTTVSVINQAAVRPAA